MICKECGAFFVRYPCPSCGYEDKDQDENIEDSSPMVDSTHDTSEEERLVKPSELHKQSMVDDKQTEVPSDDSFEEESLVKPSEMDPSTRIGHQDEDPEEEAERLVRPSEMDPASKIDHATIVSQPSEGADEDQLIKPSSLKGGSSVNPNFTSSDNSNERLLTDTQESMTVLKHKVSQNQETNDEYQTRVRDTLLEVMSLLEDLIEE